MGNVKKIGEMLKEQGLINEDQLNEALESQGTSQHFLGEIFVQKGWITDEALMSALAEQYRLAFVRISDLTIDKTLSETVPLKVVTQYKIMPVKLEGKKLTIATSNPQDVRSLDDLNLVFHRKYNIEIVLATADDIKKSIDTYYGLGANTVDKILDKKSKENPQSEAPQEVLEDIKKGTDEASVVALVNQILLQAHERRATDVHLEPYRGSIRLRYRLDGMLKPVETPASMKRLYPAIVSRIKVLSNLNLVERRTPQDGRASINVGDQKLDLRTSVMPTPSGESIVIRILPTNMLFNLKDLGFREEDLGALDELIHKSYGLFFVTGPTGSGKSTTLYAAISRINSDEKKIITVEDPVECELPGVTQIQINAQVGLSFASGLRSMLRHDPDVMMVGEVRDQETAELAIRVALTGHMVFSTLHTNDAASAITRLLEMRIDPYILASSARCFLAQRLVRVICEGCKEEIKSEWPEAKTAFRGKGCDACQGTGFRGRTVIYELLKMTPSIKELVLKRASADEIRERAIKEGMRTLHEEGWAKVNAGITVAEEVMRVSVDEKFGVE